MGVSTGSFLRLPPGLSCLYSSGLLSVAREIFGHRLCIVLVLVIHPLIPLQGQDLANIDKKNPVKVSGGMNATQTFYHAWNMVDRRDPYYFLLNANLNFDIAGVHIPFSATISSQQKNITYTQPFNMYGISPRYKALTVHLGYRSMQFSDFTLGGNMFLGAGVEVAPANSFVKASAMYGRFAKAVTAGASENTFTGEPAYERWGYGTKVTLGRQVNRQFDLIAFHGMDKTGAVSDVLADSLGMKPAENLVLGIVTRQAVTDQINFDLEYAFSAYTEDIRIQDQETVSNKFFNHLGFFFTPNISTQFNKAVSGNLTYNHSRYQFRISYRRIDPEFKTMGSVFLNNDLEDITGNLGWRMLKNKMNISMGAGVQKNNLDDALASRMKRLIGNVNWTYMISNKLNVNACYSNFTSNTKINNTRLTANQLGLHQNADSLAYNQITNSASGGVNYNTGSDKVKHAVFANGNYQRAKDSQENSSTFYNLTTGYQQNIIPAGMNITFSATYNYSLIGINTNRSAGPNIALSKLLIKKKVRSTLGVTHLQTFSNESKTGTNTMVRFSSSYKKGKHHVVTMDMTWLLREVSAGTGRSFKEFRGNVIYGFTF